MGVYGAGVAHVALAGIGLWLAVIDQHTHRLPDVIVLPTWWGSVASFTLIAGQTGDGVAWERAMAIMAVAVLVLWVMAWAPGQPLGFGDVKLGGVIATHLGWHGGETALLGFACAFVLGGVWALVLLFQRVATPHDDLAFGPWLVAGYFCGVIHATSGLVSGEII